MGSIISIDFGTTNTVVSEWVEGKSAPQALHLPGIGRKQPVDGSPFIPSLLLVENLQKKSFKIGDAADRDYFADEDWNSKLFRNMKRAIMEPERYDASYNDGSLSIGSKDAAGFFLDELCKCIIATGRSISELVLTVPVNSFEQYLRWLSGAVSSLHLPEDTTPRIIDEPTAAAFGCGIDHPGGTVLVIDFGGGTLDLSLIKLPMSRDAAGRGITRKPGQSIMVAVRSNQEQIKARVLAKEHRSIGGADIDSEMLDYILKKSGLLQVKEKILDDLPDIIRAAETAKIRLSSLDVADIYVPLRRTIKRPLDTAISRDEFERNVLKSPSAPVLESLKSALAGILKTAEAQGIGDNKIDHILLVGGTTLIPAIRQLVIEKFGKERITQKKPFEAVSGGALVLATSHPLVDFLHHSYALEVKVEKEANSGNWEIDYFELIKKRTEYPTTRLDKNPQLQPTADNVQNIDFVIAEIEESSGPGERVVYDALGHRVPEKCKARVEKAQTIRLLRNKCSVPLAPPGMKDDTNRIEFTYWIDENRQLLLSVYDNKRHTYLMQDKSIVQFE